MPRSYLDPPVPIVALATAPGEAALAVIRASGPGCIELAASAFSRPDALLGARGHESVFGELRDGASGETVDQVLASVFRSPRSPTGEDQVEFSCHGSPAVVRRALAALEAAGFVPALPGEFSFRAFCNGKMDLVAAEAVDELVRARSDAAREDALGRLEGGLSSRLSAARASLLAMIAEVELRLDYGEDEAGGEIPLSSLAALRADLEALAATFRASRLVAQGLGVALAGAPNAGKSRLFNLFLREERSIVSPEPGTTRDWIEAGLELGGLRLRLIDTAGLREAEGSVEAEGVARSRRLLDEADIVLYLVDASDPAAVEGRLPAEAGAFLALRPDAIRLWNKVDLPGAGPAPEGFHALSAATGSGFPELAALLEARARDLLDAAGGAVPVGAPGPAAPRPAGRRGRGARIANERQKLLLDRSVSAIASAGEAIETGLGLDAAALELREAAEALGEITGEIYSPEVLESIFSRFCVGK